MKKGFTMIELIFVIVILGILAAVAIPRLASTANDAKVGTAESFIGTLNRSVGPTMWSKSIRDANGSMKGTATGGVDYNLSTYTELPKGVTMDLGNCVAPGTTLTTSNFAGTFDTSALPVEEKIYCIDGNSTSAPRFGFRDATTAELNASSQLNK